MAVIPIIIPVVQDCIMQNGIRYCESQPITSHEIGIIGLFVIGVVCWAVAICYFLAERDSSLIALAITLAPFVGLTAWGFL